MTGACFVVAGFALLAGAVVFRSAVRLGIGVLTASPLLAGGMAILRSRADARPERPIVAVVIATVALYGVLGWLAPELAATFTAKPLIDRVASEIGPDGAYAFWGKYLPSAAFYLQRPPLLVGIRRELRLGNSLVDEYPDVVGDLDELGRRTAGQRLYVFTDNRKKREQELRAALGDVELAARNYAGALWVRPVSSAHQTRTQGSSK